MFHLIPFIAKRYIFVFLFALLLSSLLIPLSIILLKKFNIMDEPNARKIHTKPIPRMGGIAIYIAFIVPMISLMYFETTQKGIIIGSGIALLIGAIDDIWNVSALIKLIALMGLTFIMKSYGVVTNLPFDIPIIGREWANTIITMLWLTGICSALNALDHMDGLAGGVSIIAGCAYFAVSIQTGQFFWGLMSLSLVGSLAGFLIYNRHPAKIFMGDSGSFFLGFSLASIGIMGNWSTNPLKSAIIPLIILSVPLLDFCYVVIARRFNGTTHSIRESIAYCGKDHIGHRLNDYGFSQVGAVRIVYLLAITVSISALTLRYTRLFESALLPIQVLLIYLTLGLVLQYSKKKRET